MTDTLFPVIEAVHTLEKYMQYMKARENTTANLTLSSPGLDSYDSSEIESSWEWGQEQSFGGGDPINISKNKGTHGTMNYPVLGGSLLQSKNRRVLADVWTELPSGSSPPSTSVEDLSVCQGNSMTSRLSGQTGQTPGKAQEFAEAKVHSAHKKRVSPGEKRSFSLPKKGISNLLFTAPASVQHKTPPATPSSVESTDSSKFRSRSQHASGGNRRIMRPSAGNSTSPGSDGTPGSTGISTNNRRNEHSLATIDLSGATRKKGWRNRNVTKNQQRNHSESFEFSLCSQNSYSGSEGYGGYSGSEGYGGYSSCTGSGVEYSSQSQSQSQSQNDSEADPFAFE